MENRIIINGDFKIKKAYSYGIIGVNVNNLNTLIVKRKWTPLFTKFIRGLYRQSELHSILSKISMNEYELLCSIFLKQEVLDVSSLVSIYISVGMMKSCCDYSLMRHLKEKNSIIETLENIECTSQGSWLWPKGRKEKNETEIETAIRELKEETGIKSLGKLSNKFIVTKSIVGGVKYECKYFIMIFDTQPECFIKDIQEISEAKWVDIDTAKLLIGSNEVELFLSSFNQINL
jgi:ADP-ribose pyrophosphatase YjhB (NUDIX family)